MHVVVSDSCDQGLDIVRYGGDLSDHDSVAFGSDITLLI